MGVRASPTPGRAHATHHGGKNAPRAIDDAGEAGAATVVGAAGFVDSLLGCAAFLSALLRL